MPARRILIVDDNDLVRRSIARLLKDETSWVICGEGRTSREAVDAAVATSPDVILLDVNLPDATGFETANLIREKLPHVAFVMLSANNDAAMALACQQAGANAWLDKSNLAVDLVPTIENLRPGE